MTENSSHPIASQRIDSQTAKEWNQASAEDSKKAGEEATKDDRKNMYFWFRRNSFECEISRIELRLKQLSELCKQGAIRRPTASVVFGLRNEVGALVKALKVFHESNVSVLHIESRPSNKASEKEQVGDLELYVEIEADKVNLEHVLEHLGSHVYSVGLQDSPSNTPATQRSKSPTIKAPPILDAFGLMWFPRHISELNISSNRVLMYGAELDADHPGFKDEKYRKRRHYFADIAFQYRHGQPIPRIEYTDEEIDTWRTIYRALKELHPTHACREYRENFEVLENELGLCEFNIPQLEDVSNFLKSRTGFMLRPVAGYLSPRDFLAGLAFRVFHVTQYIRHKSDPFYTPEPDCCHELLGHAPLLGDNNFAQFSQEIGLASLGVPDGEVDKLATLYFFTVEFGLCKEQGELRVYGAGLLSCVDELKHVLTDAATIHPFDPEVTSQQQCLITTFQDIYFYTNTFEEAQGKLREFAKTVTKPSTLRYNPYNQCIEELDDPSKINSVVSGAKFEMSLAEDALRRIKQNKKNSRA